ncbi:MAG: ATP-binding cassette domain-containing protein [bacterium]|nr:ATP-binding cassette domain-containing protein [bacterium]
MASVVVQNVTKQFGPKIVLEGLSLEVRTGERVGLIGDNGSGKTTLFKLMTGQEAPDMGTVTRTRGLEVGLLAQEPRLQSERTLHDEVGRAFEELLQIEHRLQELADRIAERHDEQDLPDLMAEYDRLHARFETAGGYGFQTRINEILGGLGFALSDHSLPIGVLSGGQKCRAALGKLLLQDRQLLLLDEPTNHLDLEATRWLEKFLAGHHGGAVIVSHDRYLLDRVATKIIEVENRSVKIYPGNYSNYAASKARLELAQQRQFEKDRAFIEKERAFIDKHLSGQRTREAKGRRTRLERRLGAGEFVERVPARRRSAAIRFAKPGRTGAQVLHCRDLSKRYGDKVLLEGLNLEVFAGDRLGIVGPNGTGKTTLLRVVLGQVEPDVGELQLFENQVVGYYDQEHVGLDRSRPVIDEVHEARPEADELEVRSFLGGFLFFGDEVFKPIGKLSGGEQSRVRLAKLVWSAPDVLILDEPTNHLDIRSRVALEDALAQYEGTIIVVSHDRYFLDRTVSRLLVLERTGHKLYQGNYSFYLERLEEDRDAEELDRIEQRQKNKKLRDNKRARQARSATSSFDALSIEQIEEQIIAKEQSVQALQDRFADEAIYRDPQAVGELRSQLEAVNEELQALNQAWVERVDATDA